MAENREISPWLIGGELIFVTGINLRRTDADFCRLIDEAIAKAAAGILILTHSDYIAAIPDAVLDYAHRYDFALLEQPYSLPMVQVTELICNALLKAELGRHSLRHFISQLIEVPATPVSFIAQQAHELELDADQPLNVGLISPETDIQDDGRWQFALNQWLHQRHGPYPPLPYASGWYLLLPLDSPQSLSEQQQHWRVLIRELNQQGLRASLGVSHCAEGLVALSKAARQARQAQRFARQHSSSQLQHYQELGLNRLFAAIDDQDLLVSFCREQLGELFLDQHPQSVVLKHTLQCYFEHLGGLRQSAAALGIHRNTLNLRLEKAAKICRVDFNNAQQRLALQNALQLETFISDYKAYEHEHR